MRAISFAISAMTVGLVGAVAAGPASASPRPPSAQELVGAIHLVPGSCHHGRVAGSYLAVTFGTKAIRNSSSSCQHGAVTLLRPSGSGLASGRYSTAARSVFDGGALSLATSSASYLGSPRLYLVGGEVNADVRSVVASYQAGTYPVGAERATGHYNARTRRISLEWFSGQSFTRASAGTQFHLAGTFQGSVRPVPKGTTVNLGTASFAAGRPVAVTNAAAGRSANRPAGRTHTRRTHLHSLRLAGNKTESSGSPKLFLLAELVLVANILAFVGLSRKRGRK
ncbi:MAG: hypothetical protein JO214_12360 [Frankiaceae bacterium]|nr:hypothetical protein [Frankiaceae bacterium]